jgi:hypothetical protein
MDYIIENSSIPTLDKIEHMCYTSPSLNIVKKLTFLLMV